MKRLLVPLIAALALPTAVNAESYWLYAVGKSKGFPNLISEKFPMASLEACEQEAKRIEKTGGLFRTVNGGKTSKKYFYYSCIKGK